MSDLIIMNGTRYVSILSGNLQKKDRYFNVFGKYKGILQGEKIFNNIPLELLELEKELVLNNQPTGMKVHHIRQSFDGDADFAYSNSKLLQEYSSLYTENISLKRELITLRKQLFDFKGGDRFQERVLQDAKFSGKVRSALYSWENQQQQDGFSRFGRRPMNDMMM